MSAIYLPNLWGFLPEVLRNSVWFNGSKCDLDQSDGPFAPPWVLSCQLHTVETLATLLDDRKLTDCFTGYFQEDWTFETLCFTPPSSDVGLGNQTRKGCLEPTHKEVSPCLGEEYCVQYHWRRTFHGIVVIRFMVYSNEACFCWVTFVDARFLKQRSSNSCASHASGWSEPEPFN